MKQKATKFFQNNWKKFVVVYASLVLFSLLYNMVKELNDINKLLKYEGNLHNSGAHGSRHH